MIKDSYRRLLFDINQIYLSHKNNWIRKYASWTWYADIYGKFAYYFILIRYSLTFLLEKINYIHSILKYYGR